MASSSAGVLDWKSRIEGCGREVWEGPGGTALGAGEGVGFGYRFRGIGGDFEMPPNRLFRCGMLQSCFKGRVFGRRGSPWTGTWGEIEDRNRDHIPGGAESEEGRLPQGSWRLVEETSVIEESLCLGILFQDKRSCYT